VKSLDREVRLVRPIVCLLRSRQDYRAVYDAITAILRFVAGSARSGSRQPLSHDGKACARRRATEASTP